MTGTDRDTLAAHDRGFMRAALGLARRGLGRVAPNPAVGCLIVRFDGDAAPLVVGRGWTQPGGRPHAETEALRRAGEAAKGATAYVSLEPCDHHGKTPPCSQALIDAGVARVVVACEDPDPRVSGGGIARLRGAGIEVLSGVCEAEALDLNAGFFLKTRQGRPLFTVKTATTLDGRIATHTGESQWITGPEARARAHRLRANHDAVMVGSGTALADNPRLTCRLPGLADASPVRVVFDSHLAVPLTADLVATAASTPTWLITLPGNEPERLHTLVDCGVQVIEVEPDADGYPSLIEAARELGRRGLTRVLVEGGSHLTAGLVRAGLCDRIVWMRAPRLIGGDGIPAVQAFGLDRLADAPQFHRTFVAEAGPDVIEDYQRITTPGPRE